MESRTVTITKTPDGDISIILPNEENMVFDSFENNPSGVSFVRFYDLSGDEVVGWSADEWGEDPTCVMGAILGKLCECLNGDPP